MAEAARPPEVLADGYKMQGVFRFVLALMVLWSHSTLVFIPELSGWLPQLQLGNVAVSVFFVLSGYLMAEAVANWYSLRSFSFIINRYLRIGPPLLVAAVVSIVVHFAILHIGTAGVRLESIPEGAISYENAVLSLLAPLFPLDSRIAKLFGITPEPYYQFVRYSWAIFTEMIFYWALFLHSLCARFVGTRSAGTVFLLAAFGMFAVGTLNYGGFLRGSQWGDLAARIPLVFHMQWAPHFLLGVMISYYGCEGSRRPLLLAILFAAGAMACVQLGVYAGPNMSGASLVVGLYVLTLLAGFLVILGGRQEYSVGRFRLTRRHDRTVGNLSYPIYINHYALALAIINAIYIAGLDIPNLSWMVRSVAFILFNVIIIVCAAFLIRLTDALTDGLRDHFRGVAL
ncbi:acyltransferase family protein [Candidatus Propionivibrio aalborgensis]|uniref:acyltransferase family protein n=1 Tax=Candidatus Propionivibrio aalborgensis TaxID=1860101 RepID=UPI00164569AD|nr:acyltransferase [Candidatus Propionivibrio aalborgensis]